MLPALYADRTALFGDVLVKDDDDDGSDGDHYDTMDNSAVKGKESRPEIGHLIR